MVFSSLIFLYCFLPISVALYLLSPGIRVKNLVLTVLSVIFYAWGEPLCVLLLLVQALLGYVGGLCAENQKNTAGRILTFLCEFLILLMLLVFKYTDFLISSLNQTLKLNIPYTGIALPIGISFFTFQTLSYVIDVKHGNSDPQHFFPDLLLYISLFPQLIAGPILRYDDVSRQLKERRSTPEGIFNGLFRFSLGLGKKVLLANYAGNIAASMLDGGASSLCSGWLGAIMYTFQIYFDFSGYSDMAIGLGRIFGFLYPENFNLPYISKSITEFWRRWHISLSSFFRDYVYIPLGGNRKHRMWNLFVVWLLTGLWHGAAWNFVIWGMYYFLLLCVEKGIGEKHLERIPTVIRHTITLFLIVIGWMIFYYTDVKELWGTLRICFGAGRLTSPGFDIELLNNLPLLVICAIGSGSIPGLIGRRFTSLCIEKPGKLRSIGQFSYALVRFMIIWLLFAACTASLVGASYNPFLYFRF